MIIPKYCLERLAEKNAGRVQQTPSGEQMEMRVWGEQGSYSSHDKSKREKQKLHKETIL